MYTEKSVGDAVEVQQPELRETIISKNDTIALLRNEITILKKYRKEYFEMKEREREQWKTPKND